MSLRTMLVTKRCVLAGSIKAVARSIQRERREGVLMFNRKFSFSIEFPVKSTTLMFLITLITEVVTDT